MQSRFKPTVNLTAGKCLLAFFVGSCMPLLQRELMSPISIALMLTALCILALRTVVLRFAWVLAACYLLGFLWATINFSLHVRDQFPSQFERLNISLQGQVVGLPTESAGNWRFRFRVDQIEGRVSSLNVLTNKVVQLSCYRCPFDVSADEHWSFTVRLKKPHGYASWGAFDYEKFLFRHQIFARGYVRLKQPFSRIKAAHSSVSQWRQSIQQRLGALTNADSVGNSIIKALAIGDKSGFTHSQRKVFQASGVSHLMAISGLHVGLVFLSVSTLFRWLLWPVAKIYEWLPRQQIVLLPALASAFLYSALAGFAVSTQRAMIMLCVFVLCRMLARDVSLIKVLLIAACVVILIDPFSVLDAGFWLSFSAVLIIAVASRQADKLALVRLQPILWLGMLPITVLLFGQVSFVSPLVNLVVVPLFCLLLVPATLLAVLFMQMGLTGLSNALLSTLTRTYDWVYAALEWVTALPYAHWYATPFASYQWLLCAVLAVAVYRQSRWRGGLCLLLGLSVFINTTDHLAPDELQVVLLDVGQGLAMVIEGPDYVMVYDTGPKYSSGFTTAESVLLPYLRSRGIRYIDTLVISHADNDHFGGYQTVRDAVPVGQVLTSRIDKITDATLCSAGQRWQTGMSVFSIISPATGSPQGSNNGSCVLLVEHGATRLLIAGDIEKQVERFLVRGGVDLQADILLVPHQGSKTSSTDEFIDAVQPKLALVAAGYLNHYGHPHSSVVARYVNRGVELLSTISNGSIVLKIDMHGWLRKSYRVEQRRFWHHQKKPN